MGRRSHLTGMGRRGQSQVHRLGGGEGGLMVLVEHVVEVALEGEGEDSLNRQGR